MVDHRHRPPRPATHDLRIGSSPLRWRHPEAAEKALGRAGQSGGAGEACLPDLPREAAVLRSISFQETMAWLSLMHLPDSAN